MSEELEVTQTETPEGTTEVTTDTVQYSEVELKAMEMGWRPKEEFQGEDEDFIDAKEFVRRKPLFDKIEAQGRQLKNVTKALESLKLHQSKNEEAAVKRAIDALKAQRKEALRDGDADRFDELDDQIKDAEQQVAEIRAEAQQPVVQPEIVHPEWQAWRSRNAWYDNIGYMRKFADDVGEQYAKQGMTPTEVLKAVETAVRKEFPQRFTNPNRANAPAVETSGAPKKGAGGGDKIELSEMERRVMNDLVKAGVLTREEYIADIKKQRGNA